MLMFSTERSIQPRFMVNGDLPEILRIDRDSFNPNWCAEQFLAIRSIPPCIAQVVEQNQLVLGFMLLRQGSTFHEIIRLAVAATHRRRGIGREMVKTMQKQRISCKRPELIVDVPERMLEAQLFFRSLGFLATAVLRHKDMETGEDLFRMSWLAA